MSDRQCPHVFQSKSGRTVRTVFCELREGHKEEWHKGFRKKWKYVDGKLVVFKKDKEAG